VHCGILATTTLGAGSSGLSALSDGLRSVLRPLNMVPPDAKAVIEAALVIRGFSDARALAVQLALFQEMAYRRLERCGIQLGFSMLLVIMDQAKHIGAVRSKIQFPTELSHLVEA
jgi:hypothetical protein